MKPAPPVTNDVGIDRTFLSEDADLQMLLIPGLRMVGGMHFDQPVALHRARQTQLGRAVHSIEWPHGMFPIDASGHRWVEVRKPGHIQTAEDGNAAAELCGTASHLFSRSAYRSIDTDCGLFRERTESESDLRTVRQDA